MTRLLLCRHGQTTFNASLRFQGQVDAPLSELGLRQAELLGQRLAEERIDAAYASDLARARDTALATVGERPIPLRLDSRLREISFGRWEGLTFAEIEKRYPEDVEARRLDRVGFTIPDGGESLAEMAGRLSAFLGEVLPRHEGESVLIVSHGGTVNGIISVLVGLPLSSWWRLRNSNANITTIELTASGACLATFNDVCHLRK
ncbi:MAG: histidine phosphatase family protein [Chloroflexota bacterium]